MKSVFKSAFTVAAIAATVAGAVVTPSTASAFSRPTYSLADINAGKLGNKITFNSIIYNEKTDKDLYVAGMLRNETNFVGAREDTGINAGDKNVWEGTEITAEEGKTYIVRLYVHNNSPKGTQAVAKDVKVRFYVPYASSTEVAVNGWLTASNATPNTYLDDVVFKSADGNTPFHLEYVTGSALLENGKYAKGAGVKLTDGITNQGNASSNLDDTWTTIGYSGLDGKIPGCYAYVNYVTIKVKVVYDRDYTIEKKVRLVGDTDKTWKDSVEAKVGDKVEFQIEYNNTSDALQSDVVIRDILPSNLRYVAGSSKLYNTVHPSGLTFDHDYLVDGGVIIGSYYGDSNAYVRFTAEVVDEDLACGSNTLVNWGRGSVGPKVIQDYATVHLTKVCEETPDEPTEEKLPTTGPEAIVGGIVAAGAVATAAGYYIASRRELR